MRGGGKGKHVMKNLSGAYKINRIGKFQDGVAWIGSKEKETSVLYLVFDKLYQILAVNLSYTTSKSKSSLEITPQTVE